MMQTLPKWWKLVCYLHTLIAVIFGVSFLAVPDVMLDILNWGPVDPYIDRMLGAALLSMAWAHILSSKETKIDKVTIPIQLYLIFDVLGTIISLWGAITYSAWSAWMNACIFGFFMVCYAIVIIKK